MATTDDVFNLLKAVNEITLKRMEDKSDANAATNAATLVELDGKLDAIGQGLRALSVAVEAIRNKVGA